MAGVNHALGADEPTDSPGTVPTMRCTVRLVATQQELDAFHAEHPRRVVIDVARTDYNETSLDSKDSIEHHIHLYTLYEAWKDYPVAICEVDQSDPQSEIHSGINNETSTDNSTIPSSSAVVIDGLKMQLNGISELSEEDADVWAAVTETYVMDYFADIGPPGRNGSTIEGFVTSITVTGIESVVTVEDVSRNRANRRVLQEEENTTGVVDVPAVAGIVGVIVSYSQEVEYQTSNSTAFTIGDAVASPFATDADTVMYLQALGNAGGVGLDDLTGVDQWGLQMP